MSTDAASKHVPVMLTECLDALDPTVHGDTPVLVDATLGMGGHTENMLRRWPQVHVLGIDRDAQALELATHRLAPFADRFTPCHGEFDRLPEFLATHGHEVVDGILMDLGVSSMQLDTDDRGFSYARACPLDMRMNADDPTTAATLLNTSSIGELSRILSTYGEEKFARRIAGEIVKTRDSQPFTTTDQLVELIYRMIPAAARVSGGHPAKRTFQALRIAVNDELGCLERALPHAAESLAVGGRLAVLSFHSLEDRIVKRFMRQICSSSAPLDLPVEFPEHAAQFTDVARNGLTPSESERATNPRSASVRLRVIERIAHPPTRVRRTA